MHARAKELLIQSGQFSEDEATSTVEHLESTELNTEGLLEVLAMHLEAASEDS